MTGLHAVLAVAAAALAGYLTAKGISLLAVMWWVAAASNLSAVLLRPARRG